VLFTICVCIATLFVTLVLIN